MTLQDTPFHDARGQTWLPGLPPPPFARVVDVALCRLAARFCEGCPPPTRDPLSAELDDLSRACLLLAESHGVRLVDRTLAALQQCLAAVQGRGWWDGLPWRLALEGVEPARGADALAQLSADLTHPNSSIRLWMMELAWCVRRRLDQPSARQSLLKNVADTLGYCGAALGLAAALCPTEEDFWSAASAYQPEDFADQYANRIQQAHEQGLAIFQLRFQKMELRCRRLIEAAVLDLPLPLNLT